MESLVAEGGEGEVLVRGWVIGEVFGRGEVVFIVVVATVVLDSDGEDEIRGF